MEPCLRNFLLLIHPIAYEKAGRIIERAIIPLGVIPNIRIANIWKTARLPRRDRPKDLVVVTVGAEAAHIPVLDADRCTADILKRHALGNLVHVDDPHGEVRRAAWVRIALAAVVDRRRWQLPYDILGRDR